MIQVEKSISVPQPPDVVFAFLSDPESDPLWQNAVKEAHRTCEGPVRTGATYGITFGFLGRKMQFTAETSAYAPPYAFAYRSLSGPFRYAGRYRFTPEGDGTRIDLALEIDTNGFFGIVPESLLAMTFNKQFDHDLQALREHLDLLPAAHPAA